MTNQLQYKKLLKNGIVKHVVAVQDSDSGSQNFEYTIVSDISDLKKTTYDSELIDNNKLLDAILETLNSMEEQYYNNYIFKKRF